MAILTPPNLPVEHQIPDGMPIIYSNYTYTQALGGDLLLNFFQATQPIAVTEEDAKKIDKITARCVVRISLNPLQAVGLVAAVTDLLQTLQTMQQSPAKSS
jgi:hypothetical protein